MMDRIENGMELRHVPSCITESSQFFLREIDGQSREERFERPRIGTGHRRSFKSAWTALRVLSLSLNQGRCDRRHS
jgi:hypothetical protein